MVNQKALTAAKNKLKNARDIAKQNAVWQFRTQYSPWRDINWHPIEPYISHKKYSTKLPMYDIFWWFTHDATKPYYSMVQKWLDDLYNKWWWEYIDSNWQQALNNNIYDVWQYWEKSKDPTWSDYWWTLHTAKKKGKNTLKNVDLEFESQDGNWKIRSSDWVSSFDAKKIPTPKDSKKLAWAKLNLADVKKRIRKTAKLADKATEKAIQETAKKRAMETMKKIGKKALKAAL